MRLVLAVTALLVAAGSAGAEGPDVFIFDVLRRPDYPRAYDHMFQGERNVPAWFGSAKAAAGGTTGAGEVKKIEGENEELFTFCQPHRCNGHVFSVMFSNYGKRAVGAANIDGKVRLFGSPTTAESKALVSSLGD